jgi:type VI secretion system secreted protein VgrG
MPESTDRFVFKSAQASGKMFRVVAFQGKEEIARPYRFEIELVSSRPDADFDALLENRASFGIQKRITLSDGTGADQVSWYHGLLDSFEQEGKTFDDQFRYRAVLVPGLHRLSIRFQSVIYVEKTVPEILGEILKRNDFDTEKYRMSLERSFPTREYTVQYRETDLDFLHRLCEHEGISYFFVQEEESEVVVFEDSADNYPAIPGSDSIPYREGTSDATSDEESPLEERVSRFTCRKNILPEKVRVKEFNWRKPGLNLEKEQVVAGNSVFGSRYDYGNHYKTAEEGATCARIRAEELACRQVRFRGSSNAHGFCAGHVFSLDDHFRDSFNDRYLLTSVEHAGESRLESGERGSGLASYRNHFQAMKADLPFRPERTTPRPKIEGTLNARIDAAGNGEYAEIDDLGRYKVVLPFDLSGRDKGKASRFIRMAQPYAGVGMGMHFPLHKGTEVILVHTNGDPDRPIIAGAVPNTETASPVTSGNQTQSRIETGGGNKVSLEDNDGKQNIHLSTPTSKTTFTIGTYRRSDP